MKLVSIIMPVYNCGAYINETINCVLNQTYSNWELIIVDDCSTDDTKSIIDNYINEKIKYYKLDYNQGAAHARNIAIEHASGNYIAFLDGDDLWDEHKLEKQINFMITNNYSFTSTLYSRIDENGNYKKWISKYVKRRDYNLLLKRCPGNSTIIYNKDILGKTYIPHIRKRNDYVMWLSIIKKSIYIYELEEVLSFYRIRKNSLSSKKTELVKYQWFVYRKLEKLSFIKSSYLLSLHIIRGVFKIK